MAVGNKEHECWISEQDKLPCSMTDSRKLLILYGVFFVIAVVLVLGYFITLPFNVQMEEVTDK